MLHNLLLSVKQWKLLSKIQLCMVLRFASVKLGRHIYIHYREQAHAGDVMHVKYYAMRDEGQ